MYQDNQGDCFDRLITHNKPPVHHYDPEIRAFSAIDTLWLTISEKVCVQPSDGKTLLTVFWNQRGVVMVDFLANGTTITEIYKASILKKLRKSIETERRRMLTRWFDSCRTIPQFTTRMMFRQKLRHATMIPFSSSLLSPPCTIWLPCFQL